MELRGRSVRADEVGELIRVVSELNQHGEETSDSELSNKNTYDASLFQESPSHYLRQLLQAN